MKERIQVIPMGGESVKGDVWVAKIIGALPNPYDRELGAEGVKAIDIIFFGQKGQKSASQIFFEDNDNTTEEGRVLPHHHEPGEMEIIHCFMEDGNVITNVVGDGDEHVYPQGTKFAIAVKCTARPHQMAFGTILEELEE